MSEELFEDTPSPSVQESIWASSRDLQLNLQQYVPGGPFDDLLIFYHGGGANCRSLYPWLAQSLCDLGIGVCLPDMRGHGLSGGKRGHVNTGALLWDDVDTLVLAMRERFPGKRIHLGGHSSGAGMLLNHVSARKPAQSFESLIFVAPEFGYRARVHRSSSGLSNSFAHVRLWPFVLSAMSFHTLGADIAAVHFDWSKMPSLKEGLPFYTVGMALAVTPKNPAAQLGKLKLPVAVFMAEDDALIDADKLQAFLQARAMNNLHVERLSGARHLNILGQVAPQIAQFINALPNK